MATNEYPWLPLDTVYSHFSIHPQPHNPAAIPYHGHMYRLILLEAKLHLQPSTKTLGPVYITMALPWPPLAETCITSFNECVVHAVREAITQHAFWKPAPDAPPLECLVSFSLASENAWTYCPILGMMGGRVYLRPQHYIAYMEEFVIGQRPRVPVHVDVELRLGEDARREMQAQEAQRRDREFEEMMANQAAELEMLYPGASYPFFANEAAEEES